MYTGPFGINLIVSQSNIQLQKQIVICAKYSPDFIITSLGSPEETIRSCRPQGIKIICDVTNITHAKKIQELKADAIIAVNSGAGGHAGPLPINILVPLLKENINLPIISAGGIGTGGDLVRCESCHYLAS